MARKSTLGRWVHWTAGGAISPAFRLLGLTILALNIVIGVASFMVGAPANGALMFIVALFVIFTLWDDTRDRR